MRALVLTVLVLFVLIGAALGYANHAPVAFDLLVVQVQWPLIVLLLAAFAAGVLVTALVYGIRHWRVGRRAAKAEKRLRAVESELRHLRQISGGQAVRAAAPATQHSSASAGTA
jgi:lipopolysaccharide assembly protein A